MAVALQDLSRGRSGLEAQPLAREALQLGIGRCVRADGARELADAHSLESARHALATARQLECPAGELQPERRRLGVDAVRAADLQRLTMLLGSCVDRGEGALQTREDQCAGFVHLQRESGVDDVGRGQPVVEPAGAFLAELFGHGVDEGGSVVMKRCFELGHAFGARRGCAGDEGGGVFGHDSQLGPGRCRGELDLEPRGELPLVRPDPGHGRARVAGDHGLQSRGPARRSSAPPTRARGHGNAALLWRGFTTRKL